MFKVPSYVHKKSSLSSSWFCEPSSFPVNNLRAQELTSGMRIPFYVLLNNFSDLDECAIVVACDISSASLSLCTDNDNNGLYCVHYAWIMFF